MPDDYPSYDDHPASHVRPVAGSEHIAPITEYTLASSFQSIAERQLTKSKTTMADLILDQIVSTVKLKQYHEDFELVKASTFRQHIMFIRMHLNRIIQSFLILIQNPFIWKYALQGFLKALIGEKSLLRSLEIAVTYRCNSKCEQCSCRLSFDPA